MARDVTGSNIGLSFIDVLASALGAAVLLFVILASTPPQIASRAKAAGTFVRFEWRVAKDPKALLRIKIYSPEAPKTPYWIDPDATSDSVLIKCQAGANSILIVGFSPTSEEGDSEGNRTYVLRLNGIGSGSWRAGILYYDRFGDDFSKPPTIQVTSFVTTDGKSQMVGVAASQPTTLRYSEELLSPPVKEFGKRENHCIKP